MRTSTAPVAPLSDLARARALVLRYGWNATAYQILNPGIRLWFWRSDDEAKFVPDRWDPITALTNERAPSLLTLYATADAFSGEGRSPFLFVGEALADAVRQEARALRGLRDGRVSSN